MLGGANLSSLLRSVKGSYGMAAPRSQSLAVANGCHAVILSLWLPGDAECVLGRTAARAQQVSLIGPCPTLNMMPGPGVLPCCLCTFA